MDIIIGIYFLFFVLAMVLLAIKMSNAEKDTKVKIPENCTNCISFCGWDCKNMLRIGPLPAPYVPENTRCEFFKNKNGGKDGTL